LTVAAPAAAATAALVAGITGPEARLSLAAADLEDDTSVLPDAGEIVVELGLASSDGLFTSAAVSVVLGLLTTALTAMAVAVTGAAGLFVSTGARVVTGSVFFLKKDGASPP